MKFTLQVLSSGNLRYMEISKHIHLVAAFHLQTPWKESNGIYIHTTPEQSPYPLKKIDNNGTLLPPQSVPDGAHAIAIVGWGQDQVNLKNYKGTVDYWLCRNSWGQVWGISYKNSKRGYFKMAMYKGGQANQDWINVDIGIDWPISPWATIIRRGSYF